MSEKKRSPWYWVPSLYYAEGLPYVVVMTLSVIMYKRLDISNTDIALYTSWLYLPWVIKPLWSPLVDLLKTKRFWIITMQLVIGAGLAGVALMLPGDNVFRYTLAFMWLLAFSSATHDIAADGFYMLGMSEGEQAYFVGIRSTFYRLAMISGQGLLVMLAGVLENHMAIPTAWAITFYIMTGIFIVAAAYHAFALPRPASDVPREHQSAAEVMRDFGATFATFFKKDHIGIILGFLLLYRFAEAQLVKIASPFLLDERAIGGLGLATESVGFVYGTVGVIALTIGGILGGIAVSRDGLKRWLWWMVAAINLPNAVYVFLSMTQPENFVVVNIAVAIEQFGYGFGFTAFLMYMIHVADGPYKTAHYALCTGVMALGMMLPGMISGAIQEALGYQTFFLWVLAATIPSFVITYFIRIPADFGKKDQTEPA
ncbi:MAG: AmpG family muropeptide MFS transporter [Rhodothermales bacterium]